MENLIGWIVMVLVMQGIGSFIAKKNKQSKNQDHSNRNGDHSQVNSGSPREAPKQSSSQNPRSSNPLESFFEKIEEAAQKAEDEVNSQSMTLGNFFKSTEPQETLEPENNGYEQEWITSDTKDESHRIVRENSNAQLFEKKKASPLENIQKKSALQQAFVWKEILDAPVSLK